MEKVLNRAEVEEKYKWDLAHIFKSDEEWEKAYAQAKASVHDIERFKGRLDSAGTILEALKESEDKARKLERLSYYAGLKSAEDTRVPKYQSMAQRIQMLGIEYASAYSFFEPEILRLSNRKIDSFCQELPALAMYKRHLRRITRERKYTLSDKEEKILAMAANLATGPGNVFNLLNNADLKFGKILDENNREAELTISTYSKFIKSKDRRVREQAYGLFYGKYLEHRNSLAALRNASVKNYVFYARARKYKDSLDYALYPDEISTKVFLNLIDSVNDAIPLLHRYVSLKKKVLGYGELRMWDMYAYIAKEPDKKQSYEEAFSTVKKALESMGKDYIDTFEKMSRERWIDVLPTQNKLSGAFSSGIYDAHPHILLNHVGELHDTFTIAHEIGHSMHTLYSNTQPFVYSSYTNFCAEIASTTNEQLLMRQMLSTADDQLKAYLLNQLLEDLRSSLYRQTMFSEFERETHSMVERDEPLNADNLCRLYGGLNEKYYGKELVADDVASVEWARIPHFYTNFYVYSYATGVIAALAISKDIFERGEQAAKEYIDNFLKAGTSKPPLEILQSVGVDLTTKKPMKKAAQVVEDNLKELEKLLT